jgi:hypothetical protein
MGLLVRSRRFVLPFGLGLLLLLALAGLLLWGERAAAEEPVAEAPVVVRELTERRTQYGATYLLSNGAFRTVLSQAPVHFKDADGAWQPIDSRLVPAKEAGSYVTAAAPVTVTVAPEREDSAPIRLSWGSYEVGLDLEELNESAASIAERSASFTDASGTVSVTYEATGDGVKEAIVLASAAAPSSFRYRLSHPGL